MRFAFDDDQLAFRDAVRDLLAKGCPPEVVRAAWPDGTDEAGARKGEGSRADAGRVAKVWADLADMGVLGLAVGEDHGGLGMGPVDWVLLAEETGYAALPHPFVETACVVAPLLSDAGDPDGVLASLIDGTRQATVVPPGSTVAPWAGGDAYLVRLDHQSGADRFAAAHVEPHRHAAAADGSSSDGSNSGAGGAAASVQLDPEPALDEARRPAVLGHWEPGSVLGDDAQAAAAFHRGALGTAAQLVGLGRRMLDLTVAYVAERKQFGVPVGSQQAVKHHLADAAMKLRFAAPAVYGAAWSLATEQPTARRDVSMAKALASDAARLTARQALQCHGAIGYTTEYDLHLYLKRAEALSRAWGSAAWHRDRVASSLGI